MAKLSIILFCGIALLSSVKAGLEGKQEGQPYAGSRIAQDDPDLPGCQGECSDIRYFLEQCFDDSTPDGVCFCGNAIDQARHVCGLCMDEQKEIYGPEAYAAVNATLQLSIDTCYQNPGAPEVGQPVLSAASQFTTGFARLEETFAPAETSPTMTETTTSASATATPSDADPTSSSFAIHANVHHVWFLVSLCLIGMHNVI